MQLTDEITGLAADVSCGNRLGIANTALLATYMQVTEPTPTPTATPTPTSNPIPNP